MMPRIFLSLSILCLLASCQKADEKPRPSQADQQFTQEEAVELDAIGNWKVVYPGEPEHYMILFPDQTSWRSDGRTGSQDGTWDVTDSTVILYWDNGWNETIDFDSDELVTKGYAPGQESSAKPSHVGHVEKVESLPSEVQSTTDRSL